MKILYFHQHFSTPQGTTGIRSYEMARRLIARGHEVAMVCGRYQGGGSGLASPFVRGRRRGRVDGIDLIEFDLAYSNSDRLIRRATTFVKFAFKSIGLALTERCDVVFATTTPLTAGIPGIFARWLRGKPFVFEVRELPRCRTAATLIFSLDRFLPGARKGSMQKTFWRYSPEPTASPTGSMPSSMPRPS
jgi:hypothetical protein